MRKRLLALCAVAALFGAFTASADLGIQPIYRMAYKVDNTTTSDINTYSPLIPSCKDMYVRYTRSSSATVSLYPVLSSDTTAALIEANTRIRQFTESETYGPFNPSLSFVRFIVDRRETNATPTTIEISCGSTNAITQPVPSVDYNSDKMTALITDPSKTMFGYWTYFGAPDQFTAATYPGSGVTGNETDNQSCFAYNKAGCDGIIIDPYEYTFDNSYELAYRYTGGTGDNTWLEQNYDLSLPYMESTVTGAAGFNPAVGSWITFSGGGTGKVLAWNSGTGLLNWVHSYGTAAEGQTVTGTGGSKTLGAVSRTSNSIRPFGWSFDTVTGDSQWIWLTRKSVPTNTLALQDGRVGVNIPSGQVYAGAFETHGENPGRVPGANYAANWFEYLATTGTNDGIWTNSWFDLNLGGTANANGLGNTKTIHVRTPTLPPAYNVVWDHAAIVVSDQKGIGRNTTSAIRIESQSTYGGSGTTIGNVDFVGGNWNNGHLVLGGYGGTGAYTSGDHIWMDQTNDVLRLKAGLSSADNAPTSETNGNAIVTATGSSVYGPAIWAISNGSTFDTGTEVCTANKVGMTCQSVINFGTLVATNPSSVACGTPITSTHTFIAMCK